MTEKSRRKTKVFYRLSKVMQKRTPDQCRSHHQKLQLKFHDNLYAIMREVRRKIQKGLAEEFVDEQHRLQTERLEEFRRESFSKLGDRDREVMEGGWFTIKRRGVTLEISIESECMGCW